MRNIYTVGQLNAYIRNMFTQDYLLQALFVKGEVSNCKYHSSGHIYFTLKDPKGTINCVMFAGNRSGLSFRLAEGQQVVVAGTVDVLNVMESISFMQSRLFWMEQDFSMRNLNS